MVFRSFIIRSSMRRTSAMARRQTSSSFASRRMTRGSLQARPACFLNSSIRSLLWRSTTNAEIRNARGERRDASSEVREGDASCGPSDCDGLHADSRWLPPGHAGRTEVLPATRNDILCGRPLGAPAGCEHCCSQSGRPGFLLLHRSCERQGRGWPAHRSHCRHDGAWTGALQHLLHALSFARRQWRRHDRAAWLPAGWRLPYRAPAQCAARALLCGYHERYGAMPDYAAQIAPQDRWAIAAYIRALQLSQNAKQSDVPAGQHVEDLHQIANEQGMPPGFANPWGMPATAIYGTPNGQDNGIPGLGTTTAPAGAQSHGSNAAGQPSASRDSSGPPLAKPDAKAPGKLAGPQH